MQCRSGAFATGGRLCKLAEGQISHLPVQPRLQKYFGFLLTQITGLSSPSRPIRGAFRDRHGRGRRDAVDAEVPLTNGAEADGEVVWS
jgi:hypothetical protein